MTFEELSESRQIAIEMAARGCVSGTLSEWPMLYSAFKQLGYPANVIVTAIEAKQWAQEVMAKVKK